MDDIETPVSRVPALMFTRKEPVSLTQRERQLLSLIRQEGQISRSDLIKRTGLGQVPVFRGTEDLARKGLIGIGEAVANGRGQPSAMVTLNANAAFSAGLSIMSDSAEAILMNTAGDICARQDLTNPTMNRQAILGALKKFLNEQLSRMEVNPDTLFALGASVAGYFIGDGRQLNTPFGVDDWALVDLESEITRFLGIPVIIENSANAAAVGEYVLGWGSEIKSFAYLNITAGLGTGIILNGELFRGSYGNAGEMAFAPVVGLPYGGLSSLLEMLEANGKPFETVTEMLNSYDDSWPELDDWITTRTPTFKLTAHALRYILDVEAIIIGGRVPTQLASRIANTMTWLEDEIPPRRGIAPPKPEIRLARLPSISAAIGAATLPFKQFLFA